MGDKQLNKKIPQSPDMILEASALEKIKHIQASLVKARDYRPNKNAPRDYRRSLEESAKLQQMKHRDVLLKIVGFLAIASFILLAVVVIGQMTIRLFKIEYVGVSDAVIQIIAVSVFGQVLTVMGGLSYHLWKKDQ